MTQLVEEINKSKKYLPKKLKEVISSQVRTTLTCDLSFEQKEIQLHNILETIMTIARKNKFRRF